MQFEIPCRKDDLSQDEEYFFYKSSENSEREKILFHDYKRIYSIPGLYEKLFYDHLKCKSPSVMAGLLKKMMVEQKKEWAEFKFLDFGAGNGMVGEELQNHGARHIYGVDVIHEAKHAVNRDRAEVYRDYYVKDFSNLTSEDLSHFDGLGINFLISVAALGFGDVPIKVFLGAVRFLKKGAWLSFNIKDAFLSEKDPSGYKNMLDFLTKHKFIEIKYRHRYIHRLSMGREPFYYWGIVAQLLKPIVDDEIAEIMTKEENHDFSRRGLFAGVT